MAEDLLGAFEWVDIEKYDNFVRKLSFAQWIEVLWERCEYWEYYPDEPTNLSKSPLFQTDAMKSLVEKSRKNKRRRLDDFVSQLINGEAITDSWLMSRAESIEALNDSSNSVHKFYVADAHWLAYENAIDGMSPSEYIDKLFDKDPRYVGRDGNSIDIELNNRNDENFLVMSLNLDASDDFLIDGVRSLISKERKKRGVSPSRYLSESTISKFINLRLLPYLDICIYCNVKGISINNTMLAKILYSDEYNINPIERVRKTMPEMAKYAMNTRFLHSSEDRLPRR